MKKYNFNSDWKYYNKNNKAIKNEVTLPHDAMITENRVSNSLGGKNIGWFEGLDYVYEKFFHVSKDFQDKDVFLEFEGVYRNAEVFINGKKAGYRPYGYTNFYIDMNEFLQYDCENKIEVFSYNSDQPNSRWYSGTGIFRPVTMYVLSKKHIELNGLKIKTIDYKSPEIEVSIKTNQPGTMSIEIRDFNEIIKKIDFESDGFAQIRIQLPKAKLWDSNNPNLYICRVTFEDDVQEIKFGIRTIEVSTESGLLINGERTILYGACIHHDNGLLGAAAHEYAEYRKVKLLKEAGYNSIRSAHNPCSKALLDACDEFGMMVIDEYVDMWYIHKTKNDYASYVFEWWEKDLKDMVDKDYNHPSVIMYSIGNEVSETSQDKGINLTKQMTDYLHALDNRPVTCGINIFFNYLSKLGFGVYTDKKAEKKGKNQKGKAVGSEFFNNLAGVFGDKFMKWGATLNGSDRNTKKAFENMDVAGYNYGIKRYKKDLYKYPNRIILGTETFCNDACEFYDLAQQNKALIGDFVWAGMDYLGEVGLGAWVYEDQTDDFSYGPSWMTSGSGRLDILGNAGGEMAFTRVAFNLDPIRMAVVPVQEKKKKHTPAAWKMSNAIESWSFNGCEGKPANIEVYTKAHRIELWLNNKKIAESKNKKRGAIFHIKTKYFPGTLTAIGYDLNDKEIGQSSLVTAGNETELNLFVEEKIDSVEENLIYVHINLTDKNGVLKPLKQSKVKVKVINGTLIGLGNGCAYNKYGYMSDTNITYYGQALAIIKPDPNRNIEINVNSQFGENTINIVSNE